jgi:hypothetical protein
MADGSRHSLYAVKEVTNGTTPTNPALDLVRSTGTTLGLNKDSIQSEEIRSDRMITDFRLGANNVSGDVNFELSYGTFDDLLQGVLLSADWAAPATTGTTTLDATGTGFSRASGSFVTDGFLVGQTVTSSGYVGSGFNGKSTVTAVAALTLTTTPLSGAHGIESGTGDELVVASESIQSGTTRSSFTMVRHFADVQTADKPYYIYRGVELNTMTLSVAANAIVTGTFAVVGKSQTLATDLTALGTPTYPAATTTKPLDSFTGALEEGGVVIAVITEMTLTLENGLAPRFVVGDANTILPSVGRSNLTGQVTAFFEDSDLVEKFINETESSLVFTLPDGVGNRKRFRIPRIQYTGGQPDVSGEGPVTLTMPFQALLDADTSTNLVIERTPL